MGKFTSYGFTLATLTCALASLAALPATQINSDSSAANLIRQTSTVLNDVAKNCSPAVVSISSFRDTESPFSNLDPFQEAPDQISLGIGSGVILKPDGTILTNHHVVQNSQKVTVSLDDRIKLSAHVIGSDQNTDLAVIQLDKKPPKPLTTLSFADSDKTSVGDWAIAIGSPFGLNRSVTTGIISAKGRGRLGVLDIEDFLQTDAAINPGNSGGPLLNTEGKMIGINTAIFSQSGGFIGIGFAIPSKIAKTVAEEIIAHGRVIRGWIGISAQDLDKDLAKYFSHSSSTGALVSQVLPRGPADQASLKTGDIITQYGSTAIQSADNLKVLVSKSKAASLIPLKISRNGKEQLLSLTIKEQPRPKHRQQAGQAGPKHYPALGLSLEDIPPEFTQLFGISPDSGAIVSDIKPGSPAFNSGIGIGDIVLTMNRVRIHNSRELTDLIKKSSFSELHVFYVQKGPNEKLFIPVNTKEEA